MSDLKWIKIGIGLPDNRKIKKIRRLPDGNNIVLFWVFLLTKAGESNSQGGLLFLEDMPYSPNDLAEEFDFSNDFVNFAIATLEKLQMVETYEGIIYIKNWDRYQNVDGMERVKKLNAERNRKYRERKKQERIQAPINDDGSVTSHDGTDIELDKDKELDKELIPYVEIINYLNSTAGKNYRSSTRKTKDLIKARWNEGFVVDDFIKVINIKSTEWKNDEKMQNFIRPETLFGTKFESYLNQESKSNGGNDGYDYGF